MHFHLPFNALEVLWTLTFAAHLVLLVVLLGRDRVARFPWFTASTALFALRLLSSRLLFGKLPQIALSATFIVIAALGALLGIAVVIEMARRAFAGVRRASWVAGALALMALGAVVVSVWGPWPAWKTLAAGSSVSNLELLQFLAQKGSLLVNIENIALALLVVLVGRKVGAGWRSHTQRILIGLSAASISQLAVQGIWEAIARTAAPHSMEEYQRVLDLRDRMYNANSAIYVAVLIWWIACLWIDEPTPLSGAGSEPAIPTETLADPGEELRVQTGTTEPSSEPL